jgi:hypothetical protein
MGKIPAVQRENKYLLCTVQSGAGRVPHYIGNAHVVLPSLAGVSWADIVSKLSQCMTPEKIVP